MVQELTDNQQTNLQRSVDEEAEKKANMYLCGGEWDIGTGNVHKVIADSILINQLLEFILPFVKVCLPFSALSVRAQNIC